jgi:hypothetical protein
MGLYSPEDNTSHCHVRTSNTIFIHFYGRQLSVRKYLRFEIETENIIHFLCDGHKIHVAYIKRLFPK